MEHPPKLPLPPLIHHILIHPKGPNRSAPNHDNRSTPYVNEKIGEMQLHLCMHMKIPPCIDYIIGHYYNLSTSGKRVDVHQLTSILKTFDYLPIHYNDTAFNAIFNKILQLAEN